MEKLYCSDLTEEQEEKVEKRLKKPKVNAFGIPEVPSVGKILAGLNAAEKRRVNKGEETQMEDVEKKPKKKPKKVVKKTTKKK